MRAKEVKWATGGFVAGFLLCYLLVGAFRSEPAASPVIARAAPGAAWLPVPAVPVVRVTNLRLPELRMESPPRWVGRGLHPPRTLNGGYSLDLIDTHYQLPQKPEAP
jgi:hypothetical protein